MDTDTIRRDVHAIRRALESCHGDLDPTIFGRLPRDGLIVDITRNQFGKDGEPVLVAPNRSWQDAEFPEQKRREGFGEPPPHLCDAYARIAEELESTPDGSVPGV